jgi:import inner membrane translocase subunit TIM44
MSRAPEPVVRLLSSVSDTYETSENPVVSSFRTVASKVAGIFEENETAKVVRKFKELDPDFQQEVFLRELREYIVPEVVDAYVSGDLPALQGWCSEAVSLLTLSTTPSMTSIVQAFNVLASGLLPLIQQGLIPDCQVLDIRELDVGPCRMCLGCACAHIITARHRQDARERDPSLLDPLRHARNARISACGLS